MVCNRSLNVSIHERFDQKDKTFESIAWKYILAACNILVCNLVILAINYDLLYKEIDGKINFEATNFCYVCSSSEF